MQFHLPLKGKNTAFAASTQPSYTSPRMNNFRPREVLGKRMRGGQRPGLAKQYDESLGAYSYGSGLYGSGAYGYSDSLGNPIICMCEIVTVQVS